MSSSFVLPFQKSTLSENWGHSSRSSSSLGPHDGVGMKYVIHKQPLSLDRFFLHEVTAQEAAASKLDNCFVLICLNRFQQIVQVHTFQADTEQLKVRSSSVCQYYKQKSSISRAELVRLQ